MVIIVRRRLDEYVDTLLACVDILSTDPYSQARFAPSTTTREACPSSVTTCGLSGARGHGASVTRAY
jgi:hypothetical protein